MPQVNDLRSRFGGSFFVGVVRVSVTWAYIAKLR